jgi:hypothetical protein
MKRFVAAIGVLFLLASFVGTIPASASESEDAFHLDAFASLPVDGSVCGGAVLPPALPNAVLMSGNLVGCWYTDTGVLVSIADNHVTTTMTFTGTEHFVGCLGRHRDGVCHGRDRTGTWQTTYVFTGVFSDTTGFEVSGGCTHPIVPGSGTGAFKGAKGTILMTDNIPPGGAPFVTSNVFGSVFLGDD